MFTSEKPDKKDMKRFVSYVRRQLENRSDSEHNQAFLRLVIVIIGAIYSTSVGFVSWPILTSLLVSCAIIAHIIYDPSESPARRIVGAIQDNLFTTFLLFYSGPKAALFLFVFPFITVGNGFRFGVRYLAFSGTLAAACMSFLIFRNPEWNSEFMVGVGILVSNVTVTIYTGLLLNKLRQVQQRITKMATHDALTGLPNRSLFMEGLSRTIQSRLTKEYGVTCIYFDLDGFKAVNDQFGHKTGDHLLTVVADKVRSTLRASDLVARLGGDEFTVLLDTTTKVADAEKVAGRIIRAIESIQMVDGHAVRVSASVGIAYLPAGVREELIAADDLLKLADEQMYRAKKQGKGRSEMAIYATRALQNAA